MRGGGLVAVVAVEALRPPPHRDLPAGFAVTPDRGVRFRDDGTVLVGGSPPRVVRLTRRGAAAVAGWRRGRRPRSRAELALARRLLDAGLIHPCPAPGHPQPGEVTVVVPVRDRPDALARCLSAVGPCHRMIVVDDGSAAPENTVAVAREHGAYLVCHGRNRGPAAARNTGLAHATTPYVAFVDSDCRPAPGWLPTLLPHFQDPAVAAVAPRVTAAGAHTWIARYDASGSSLDMGAADAPVAPRTRVAYVPAAALVVRRCAVGAGFDPGLRLGEDVDLVWRLWEAGWSVRYVPAARIHHETRATAAAWAARRFGYGTSAGPLGAVHPTSLVPMASSGWSLAAWGLAVAGRPGAGLAVVAAAGAALSRRLPPHRGRVREAARLAGLGTLAAGESLATAVTQVWWPLAVPVATVSRRGRRWLAAAAVTRVATAWARQRPRLDPVRFGAACALDDLSYGAGVWLGCLRARTAAPLLPRLPRPRSRRPGDGAHDGGDDSGGQATPPTVAEP